MKALPILTFAAGGAAGALAMWFLHSPPAPEEATAGTVTAAQLTVENKTLTEKVQSLEKQIAAGKGKGGRVIAGADAVEAGKPQVITTRFDDARMQEVMKQHAEREANREADKLALRLKLTPEQKESLKKFLIAEKEKEREVFRTAVKEGGKGEMKRVGRSKDEFLKSLLTPEQQADYARSQEEQRTAGAEEYAQRKVRRLNDQLSLSEEQKDKLFQAYAQQRLAATDPGGASELVAKFEPLHTGSIAFAAVAGDGAGGEPVEIDLEMGDMILPAGGDLEHSVMEGILTPEQLGVYDQRKAEEKERGKKMGLPDLPGLEGTGIGGGAVRVEVKRTETAPAKQQ